MALSDFPRYPLLFGASPVRPLERLSDHLGGARIWAKREDSRTPSRRVHPIIASAGSDLRIGGRPGWGAIPAPSEKGSFALEFRSRADFADAVDRAFAGSPSMT